MGSLASWPGRTRGRGFYKLALLGSLGLHAHLSQNSFCVGGVGGRIPQTCGPLGAPCFLSGHMVASNTHNQSMEWGRQETTLRLPVTLHHTPLQGSWDTAGGAGGLIYLFTLATLCCV